MLESSRRIESRAIDSGLESACSFQAAPDNCPLSLRGTRLLPAPPLAATTLSPRPAIALTSPAMAAARAARAAGERIESSNEGKISGGAARIVLENDQSQLRVRPRRLDSLMRAAISAARLPYVGARRATTAVRLHLREPGSHLSRVRPRLRRA
jgi:hypothetical protein